MEGTEGSPPLEDLSNVVQESCGHHIRSEEYSQELEKTKSQGQSAGQRHKAEESLGLGPSDLDCQVSGWPVAVITTNAYIQRPQL